MMRKFSEENSASEEARYEGKSDGDPWMVSLQGPDRHFPDKPGVLSLTAAVLLQQRDARAE